MYRIFKRWQAVNQQWKVLNYIKANDLGDPLSSSKGGGRGSRSNSHGLGSGGSGRRNRRFRTILDHHCGYTILHILSQLRPHNPRFGSTANREVVMRVTTVWNWAWKGWIEGIKQDIDFFLGGFWSVLSRFCQLHWGTRFQYPAQGRIRTDKTMSGPAAKVLWYCNNPCLGRLITIPPKWVNPTGVVVTSLSIGWETRVRDNVLDVWKRPETATDHTYEDLYRSLLKKRCTWFVIIEEWLL